VRWSALTDTGRTRQPPAADHTSRRLFLVAFSPAVPMTSIFRRLSLRQLLTSPFVLQIVAVVLVIGWLSLQNGQRAVNDIGAQLRESISERVLQYVSEYTETPTRIVHNITHFIEVGLIDPDDTRELTRFLHILSHDKDTTLAGVGFRSGRAIGVDPMDGYGLVVREADGNGRLTAWELDANGDAGAVVRSDPYDLHARPWFRTGSAATGPTWVDIYPHAVNGDLELTAVSPLRAPDGRSLGVAASSISLYRLSNFLAQVSPVESGEVFVIERSGKLVASSADLRLAVRATSATGDDFTRIQALDSENPLVRRTTAHLRQQYGGLTTEQPVTTGFDFDGEPHLVDVSPFGDGNGLDWLIVAVMPESSLLGAINANTRQTVAFGLVFATIAILFGMWMAGMITAPLSRLNRSAKRVAHGDLTGGGEHGQAMVPAGREVDELVGSFRLMTSRLRESFEQMRHLATHDSLTGLANRSQLVNRLDVALKRARHDADYQFALLFLDLDHFKVVNDSLGHHVGDQVLTAIAEKLRAFTRASDLAARLGGDEFVLLLEGLADRQTCLNIADRLLEDVQTTVSIADRDVHIDTSIGVVFGSAGYDDASELLRDADIALYRAKARGRSRYEIFDASMRERARRRQQLESELRDAIARGGLEVHYQPIVSLTDGHVIGFEALCRWPHATFGWVDPTEFVTLAEETGLIVQLDRWVLREACAQLGHWIAERPGASDLWVSVNLSSRDLGTPDLIDFVDQSLHECALSPSNLNLEITERMLIDDVGATIALMTQLRDRGIEISIDDFGTGYSSLSYLYSLPATALKIDKSFVGTMEPDSSNCKIVSAVVALSNELGIDAIAEGIEEAAQFELLRAMGCEFGQGFLFSAPVPAAAAQALLDPGLNLIAAHGECGADADAARACAR
jgi:diguanylate cyclase (GGDEF)-like protein